MMQDLSDHGASKEPVTPPWARTNRFHLCNNHDQWCKITPIMVLQGNQWIHPSHTFNGTFDAPISKTRLPPKLRWVLSCESPGVFLHFPLEEKGPQDPLYQLGWVLAKGRHLGYLKSYWKHCRINDTRSLWSLRIKRTSKSLAQCGFMSSFDALWSEWSCRIDPDPAHSTVHLWL